MQCKPSKSIQEVVAIIRQDAITCDFLIIKNCQDEAMCTRFICSANNEAVLKAVFKEEGQDLTFAKAIEIFFQTEDAAKVAKETAYNAKPSLFNIANAVVAIDGGCRSLVVMRNRRSRLMRSSDG